jgi:hypothetical protein
MGRWPTRGGLDAVSHYQNSWLCRVLGSLLSAFCRALGKEAFVECRTRQSPALCNDRVYQEQGSQHRNTLGEGGTRQRAISSRL